MRSDKRSWFTLDKLLLVAPTVAGKVLSKPAELAAAASVRRGRSSAHTLQPLGATGVADGRGQQRSQ